MPSSPHTLVAFTVRPPRRRPVDVQVNVVDGTPYVWVREAGGAPALIRGVRALQRLQDGIARALAVARPGVRRAPAGQLPLTGAATVAGESLAP